MAMACLRLVTFLPLRPDFSLPCFISCISRSTFLPAEGEYLGLDDDFFSPVLLRALVFFAPVLLRDELLLLRALAFFEELFRDADFFVPLDLFWAALVAMTILPKRLRWLSRSSCCLIGTGI